MAKLPPAAPMPDLADDVLGRLNDRVRADEMRSAFVRLNQKDQDILTLCVLEELSLAQAAAALRIPIGTVKSRLSRAKHHLANHLISELDAIKAPEGALE